MKKIPFIQQYDATDCGPACLKMIIQYYGKDLSLDQLREMTYSTRDGISLGSISRAAEQLGFKTAGGRVTVDTLFTKAPFPCIIHWNQDHFVILYDIKKKRRDEWLFKVVDPGKGRIIYSKNEFLDGWLSTATYGEEKGIVLLLEPTTVFYEQKMDSATSTRGKIHFLYKYLSKYKRYFSQLIIGLVVGSLLQLIFPLLTQLSSP